MSDLVLVRHGESMGNVWSNAYADDRLNFLSLKGMKQAEMAGIDLHRADYEFAHVITSNLTRAMQTAVIIMQTMDDWKRHYEVVPGLNELNQQDHAYNQEEVFHDFVNRVDEAWEDQVQPLLDDGHVMCVCHHHVVQALIDILGVDRSRLPNNGTVTPNAMPIIWNMNDRSNLRLLFDPFKWQKQW